jgi:predicted phage terminase large subunit-like protein
LSELGTLTYQQLRGGDWEAEGTGGRFDVNDLLYVEPNEVPYHPRNLTVRYWDLAASDPTEEEPDPDWSAGVRQMRSPMAPDWVREKVMREGGNVTNPFYYVQDISRIRRSTGHVLDRIETVARKDGLSVPVWVEQERGGSGKGMVAVIRDRLDGFTVRGLQPKGDKTVRASQVAARSREHHYLIVKGDWNEDFVSELGLFGLKGVHDDQVDGMSGGYEALKREAVMKETGQGSEH